MIRERLARASRRDMGGESLGDGPYGIGPVYCAYCNQVRPRGSGTNGRYAGHRDSSPLSPWFPGKEGKLLPSQRSLTLLAVSARMFDPGWMARPQRGPGSDRLIVARLSGTAWRNARWGDLTEVQKTAGVTELREVAGDRADLLAENLTVVTVEGSPAQHRLDAPTGHPGPVGPPGPPGMSAVRWPGWPGCLRTRRCACGRSRRSPAARGGPTPGNRSIPIASSIS